MISIQVRRFRFGSGIAKKIMGTIMSNRRFRFPFRPESEYPVPIPVRFWKSSSGIAKKFWEINIYLQYHWIKYWTILAWSSISNMAAFLQYRNRIFIIWLESEPDILILAEMGTGKEPKLPIWPDGTQNFFLQYRNQTGTTVLELKS